MITREEQLRELDRELAMRRKVYHTVKNKDGKVTFVKIEEQKQYDIMVYIRDIIDSMPRQTHQSIYKKVQEKERLKKSQQSMF